MKFKLIKIKFIIQVLGHAGHVSSAQWPLASVWNGMENTADPKIFIDYYDAAVSYHVAEW